MPRITEYKVTASYPILYSYVCENCGKSVTDVHVFSSSASSRKMMDNQQKQTIAGLRSNIDRGVSTKKGRYPFKDKCPFCHRRQSWSFTYQLSVLWVAPLIALLAGIMLCLIPAVGDYWYFFILGLPAAAFLVSGIYILIRKIAINGVKEKRVPTIDWCNTQASRELAQFLMKAKKF